MSTQANTTSYMGTESELSSSSEVKYSIWCVARFSMRQRNFPDWKAWPSSGPEACSKDSPFWAHYAILSTTRLSTMY
ncbi:hypothetical protein OXX79_011242 [Metschnikowia pulcherrima]